MEDTTAHAVLQVYDGLLETMYRKDRFEDLFDDTVGSHSSSEDTWKKRMKWGVGSVILDVAMSFL
jgi:hypothetical protein